MSAVLRGPNNFPCGGGQGTQAFGVVTVERANAKGSKGTGDLMLRVGILADGVRPKTSYNVHLATTVSGNGTTGCQLWTAGTTSSSATGSLRFSGVVGVPSGLGSFEAFLSPIEVVGVGFTTAGFSVATL